MLPIAVLALLVMSVVPLRYLGPLTWMSDLVRVAEAPVSQPMRSFGSWLSPAVAVEAVPEQLRIMEQQAEEWQTLYRREQRENRLLRARIEELSRGVAVNSLPVRQVPAPVISGSSDLSSGMLTIRVGRNSQVEVNTVVVVGGTQLLGRVERVGTLTCQARPITDRGAMAVRGRVAIDDTASPTARSLACLLRATGVDGLLMGDVQDPAELAGHDSASIDDWLEIGQTVRLDDDSWPANAQMLVIGEIVHIEPAPQSPLRRVITVRPRVMLSRVSEVMLRVVQESSGVGAGGGGGAP